MGLDGEDPLSLWTTPDRIHQYWQENVYPDDAPLMEHCRKNVTPRFTGSAFETRNSDLSAPRRHFLEDLASEGVSSMVAMPVHTGSMRESGFFNFGTELGAREFQRLYKDRSMAIHMGSIAAFNRIRTLTKQEWAVSVGLTSRERECLLGLSRGFRNDLIAERINIKPVTVAFHIANARRKLRARTREQALVNAIQLGLVAP